MRWIRGKSSHNTQQFNLKRLQKPFDEKAKDHRQSFYSSIDFVDILFDKSFGERTRYWLDHIPIMFNRRIMADMQARFEVEFAKTSSHQKRQKNDMQIEFSYVHWLLEAGVGTKNILFLNLFADHRV